MSALPRPAREGEPIVGRGAYRSEWSLASDVAGAWLVQVVRTEARWRAGEAVVVEYAGVYAEAFRCDARDDGSPRPWRDVHALSVWADGWTPAAIRDLLAARDLRDAAGAPWAARAPARLEVEKTFSLGRGEVEDLSPRATATGFALLAVGPSGPWAARVVLDAGSGPLVVSPSSPLPRSDLPPAGTGRLAGPPAFVLVERFVHDFSTDATRLEDDGGYRPVDP